MGLCPLRVPQGEPMFPQTPQVWVSLLTFPRVGCVLSDPLGQGWPLGLQAPSLLPLTAHLPQTVAVGRCPWTALWEARTPAWAGGRGKSVFATMERTSVGAPCSPETGY